MSQSNCPSDSEILVGMNRPQGLGGFDENVRPTVNPAMDAIAAEFKQQREQMSQRQLLDRAAATIGPDMLPQGRANVQQRVQLMKLSGEMQKWVHDAGLGVQRRQQELSDALRAVSGATVHDASLWLNITNAIAKRMEKAEAGWDKWAILNMGTEGRSVKDNPLVRAQEMMRPKTQGLLQKYLYNLREQVHKPAKPFADRVHMDIEDFMTAIGEYANMRHMPEANAELLRTWEADLAVARAQGDFKTVQELTNQVADLRAHLNSDTPPDTLMSAGYTDAQARRYQEAILRRLDLTEADANMLSDTLTNWKKRIDDDRRAAGMISPEVQARWPNFQYYVPLKSKIENTTGAPNVANIYNPGKYYARQGSTNPPDSAYHTINQYARRAAFEMGMQDLGVNMIAAMETAKAQNRDIGLRSYKYSEVIQALHDKNEYRRSWAERLMNDETGGGIVVDMPIRDAAGNVIDTQKTLLTFDQNWRDSRSGMTGVDLNQAMMQNVKSIPGFSSMARLTSLYGQLNTRFNPAFAAPNSMRDIFERTIHMTGRDYKNAAGQTIRGSSLTGRFLTNIPSTMKLLMDWKRGTLDMTSRDGMMLQSYIENGLHQEYTRGKNNPHMSLEDVINGRRPAPEGFIETQLDQRNMRGLKDTLNRFDQATFKRVLGVLDNWNDMWNNIAPLAHYKALLDAGVETKAAAHGALEIFDLYQKGTVTPMLSTLFPFVKPTVQTGKAMARTFGLAPNAQGKFQMNYRGLMAVGATYAAITALLPFFKDSMGYDEETGVSRFDMMPMGELQRYMPIGFGDGSYAKMYLGFGPSRFAATAAVGMDRVQRGLMTTEDFAREMLFAVAKEVSPTDWPEFSMREKPLQWIEQAFAPTIAKPLFDIMANTNWRGGKLVFERNDNSPAAFSGRLSTPAAYHKWAEDVYKTWGIDLAPEQWKTLYDGYAIGPLRLLRGFINQDARARGAEQNATEELGPWLSAFGATMFYGKTANLSRNMFYDELNRYDDRARRDGVKLTSTSYGRDADKRVQYQRAQLADAGWDSEDIDEYMHLREVLKDLRQLNKDWKASKLPDRWFAEEDMSILEADFEELAIRQSELYTRAVENIRRYEGARL